MKDRTFTVLLAVVLTVAAAGIQWNPHRTILNWDEVNYVTAARLGFGANAWDEGSLSPRALLAFIGAKRQHQASQLPQGYEEERDPLLLRNLHPPFIVYLVVPFAWYSSEAVLRVGQLLGAWALLGVLLLAHRWTSYRPTRMGQMTVGVLGLWAGRLLFSSIQCHGWMTIWTLASVVALSKWLHKREWAWGVAASVFLALTVVTLHTGLVVLVGAVVTVLILNRVDLRFRARCREVAVAGAVAWSGVLLLWPGSVAKLSLLRIFAQYAYLMRIGKEWAGSRALLGQNALALLPLLALLPAVTWWVWARQRSAVARWVPAFVVGVLYAIPVVPHMVTPTYALPAFGSLIPLMGWLVDSQTTRWRTHSVVGATCLLVALSCWATPVVNREDAGRREDLSWLQLTLRDHETLADGAHILRHYLGPTYRIRTIWVTYEGDALLLRKGGEYLPLTPQDTVGRFVLIEARRRGFPASAQRIRALAGCSLAVRSTVLLFDCTVRTHSDHYTAVAPAVAGEPPTPTRPAVRRREGWAHASALPPPRARLPRPNTGCYATVERRQFCGHPRVGVIPQPCAPRIAGQDRRGHTGRWHKGASRRVAQTLQKRRPFSSLSIQTAVGYCHATAARTWARVRLHRRHNLDSCTTTTPVEGARRRLGDRRLPLAGLAAATRRRNGETGCQFRGYAAARVR